jgi:hypothetical protein
MDGVLTLLQERAASPRAEATLGDLLSARRRFFQAAELLAIELGESQSSGPSDDAVEDGPTEAEAAGLAGEATDDLGATANLLQRAFQEVGAAPSASQPPRLAQMRGQSRQIISQAGRGAGEGAFQFGDRSPQPVLSVWGSWASSSAAQ